MKGPLPESMKIMHLHMAAWREGLFSGVGNPAQARLTLSVVLAQIQKRLCRSRRLKLASKDLAIGRIASVSVHIEDQPLKGMFLLTLLQGFP
jgi:hypothetical protein